MQIDRRVSNVAEGLILAAGMLAALTAGCGDDMPVPRERVAEAAQAVQSPDTTTEENALDLVREGRNTFRHDTFGDEAYWGDTLRLHEAIKGAALGGTGPG